MKNVSLLFLTFMYTLSIQAQPVITEAIAPTIGETWEVTFLVNDNFDPGPEGANQTWDFSNMDVSAAFDLSFETLDPSTVLGASNFPNATFVWYLAGFEIYNFYSVNADALSLVGGESINNNEIDFMTIFTDPEDGMHFPLTFGDNYTYYSQFEQYVFGSLISENDRNGSVEADAYGTITTPEGTFENVLRLKITETSFGLTSTQYAWFDVNNFTPVFLYESSSDPEEEPYVYFSTPHMVNAVADLDLNISTWNAWYSPSENQINIEILKPEITGKTNLQIFSIDGKLLTTAYLDSNTSIQKVNLPELANCKTLILNLVKNGKVSGKKIMACK